MNFKLLLLCVLFTSALGSSSFAQTTTIQHSKEELADDKCKPGQPLFIKYKGDLEGCLAAAIRIFGGGTDESTKTCKTSLEDLKKARSEFSKQCQASGVSSTGKKCEVVADMCINCSYSEEEDGKCGANIDNVMDKITEQEDKKAERELAAGTKYTSKKSDNDIPYYQLNACLPVAKARLPKVQKELKSLRKDVDEAAADLEKTKLEVGKANSNLQTEQQEFENAIAELTEQLDDNKTKLNEAMTAQNEADMAKLRGLRNEITKLERKLVEYEVQKAVEKAKVAQICEDIAEKEVQKRTDTQNAKAMAGVARSSSLKALTSLKLNGRTSKKETERRTLINACRQDPAKYTEPLRIVEQKFDGMKGDIAAQIGMIVDEVEQISIKISGSGEEESKKKTKMEEKAKSQYEKILKAHYSKAGVCDSETQNQQNQSVLKVLQAAYKKGTKNQGAQKQDSCTGLKGEIIAANAQAQREQAKLDLLNDDLTYTQKLEAAVVEAAGGDGSVDEDFSAGSFTSTYSDYYDAIEAAQLTCCSSTDKALQSSCDQADKDAKKVGIPVYTRTAAPDEKESSDTQPTAK